MCPDCHDDEESSQNNCDNKENQSILRKTHEKLLNTATRGDLKLLLYKSLSLLFPPTTRQVSWVEKANNCTKHGAKIKHEYNIYPFLHFITLFSYKSVITNHNFSREQWHCFRMSSNITTLPRDIYTLNFSLKFS